MIAKTNETLQFDAIDDVVSDIAKGRIVIVTDDADRENEGDLVMAAEKVTPEAINFMATHGRGLICAPISNERAEQLGLQRMVVRNREKHKTDFTVSVDAARGVTTGISAYDRATTILAIANPKSSPEDLNQPGHVFPLRAKDGGVLRRAGHTAEINCTPHFAKFRRKIAVSWFICARRDAGSGSRQKFTLTNCRRKDSTRSRQTRGSGIPAICEITV